MFIFFQGYDIGKSERQNFGPGIYSTSDPRVAETYAKGFIYKGGTYLAMLQNRVDINKTRTIWNVKENENLWSDYYVTTKEDGIRPYALLIKKTGQVGEDEETGDTSCCSIS